MQEDIQRLVNAVAQRFGTVPRTPGDFSSLSIAVFRVTGKQISISTLKRLWKYVPSSHQPSLSTLNILANFAGTTSWNAFCQLAKTSAYIESSFADGKVLHAREVSVGRQLTVEWSPMRQCVLQSLGNNWFVVNDVSPCKLQKGDKLHIAAFAKGLPMVATEVLRNGQNIGQYVAGTENGLLSVQPHEPIPTS